MNHTKEHLWYKLLADVQEYFEVIAVMTVDSS